MVVVVVLVRLRLWSVAGMRDVGWGMESEIRVLAVGRWIVEDTSTPLYTKSKVRGILESFFSHSFIHSIIHSIIHSGK